MAQMSVNELITWLNKCVRHINDAAGAASTGAGGTGTAGATDTANSAASMVSAATTGAAAAAGATLATGAASATATPGVTGATSTTCAIVVVANTVTPNAPGTVNTNAVSAADQETQSNIILSSPTSTLDKDFHKTLLNEQLRLEAQLHTFLLQDSPDLEKLNDTDNNPVLGIINIPKSSTIRVIRFFGVVTNPIGVSSPISGKILSIASDGSSKNLPHIMVLQRGVFHKTSIWVPTQEAFDFKIINSQAFPIFKNTNVYNEDIILKAISIGVLLVYDGFNADLDSITIYKRVNTLDHQYGQVTIVLQMGCCESPHFFCAGSETARDIISYGEMENSTPLA